MGSGGMLYAFLTSAVGGGAVSMPVRSSEAATAMFQVEVF